MQCCKLIMFHDLGSSTETDVVKEGDSCGGGGFLDVERGVFKFLIQCHRLI
jgi:hypothetical protein